MATPRKRGPGRPPGSKEGTGDKALSTRVITIRIPAELDDLLRRKFETGESGADSYTGMLRMGLAQWSGVPDSFIILNEITNDLRMIRKPVLAILAARMGEMIDAELPALLDEYIENVQEPYAPPKTLAED